MRSKASSIEQLRLAIDCLPARTRVAMLEGVGGNEIIVGAYTSSDGVCPMLAAHRRGGRTDFLSFARAWDAFSGARRSRRATVRELRVLRAQLEASLMADESVDLHAAIAEHRELVRRGETVDLAGAITEHRTLVRSGAEAHARAAARGREFALIQAFDLRGRRRRLDDADYERALGRLQAALPAGGG
jgi:hypothetical protein